MSPGPCRKQPAVRCIHAARGPDPVISALDSATLVEALMLSCQVFAQSCSLPVFLRLAGTSQPLRHVHARLLEQVGEGVPQALGAALCSMANMNVRDV